jgi:ribonucleoside-diphosphate reductase alpha chain
MPEDATVSEVAEVYLEGWRSGLKALAVYRDNCKVGQPLSSGSSATSSGGASAADKAAAASAAEVRVEYRPVRRRLPKKRPASTTSFTVGGAQGYMISSSYPDDGLGELFLKMSKQGSTLAGMMDAFSIAVSIGLQYGVPLETYVEKFTNMRFEPAGLTDDPDVRMSASIMDYVFRRLALDHLPFETRSALGIYTADERQRQLETGVYEEVADDDGDLGDDGSFDADSLAQSAPVSAPAKPAATPVAGAVKPVPAQVHSSTELMEAIQGRTQDSPMCLTCGVKMRPAGSCYVCEGCGSTSGCS